MVLLLDLLPDPDYLALLGLYLLSVLLDLQLHLHVLVVQVLLVQRRGRYFPHDRGINLLGRLVFLLYLSIHLLLLPQTVFQLSGGFQ